MKSKAAQGVALAQINAHVGDLEGNTERIRDAIAAARKKKAYLVVTPELAVTGYPPQDLLFDDAFIEDNISCLDDIASACKDIACIAGFVDQDGRHRYNAAAVIENQQIIGVYHKRHLPNYDVFDEQRYFTPGRESPTYSLAGQSVGVTICEDLWEEPTPLKELKENGADLVVNLSASPFHVGKHRQRLHLITTLARNHRLPNAYCNLVGGQDDLVFDGGSMLADETGTIICQAKRFATDLLVTGHTPATAPAAPSDVADIHDALTLALHDYVTKNGFTDVVLGLSGGIDSAVTCALAARALGPRHVTGIAMPGPYTRPESLEDANRLATNLGITYLVIPITDVVDVYHHLLASHLKDHLEDQAGENLQARVRANILMAYANAHNALSLATGNKSELAVGYTTLYGDLAGAYAPLVDVAKTRVYELATHINATDDDNAIPPRTITRPPSAELRPDQVDTDTLPPYDVLDRLLAAAIEDTRGKRQLIDDGFAPDLVDDILERIRKNEFKRAQAPPGPKITYKAFGIGRRMPITCHPRH